jgi:hypothetical protein
MNTTGSPTCLSASLRAWLRQTPGVAGLRSALSSAVGSAVGSSYGGSMALLTLPALTVVSPSSDEELRPLAGLG